MNASSAFRWLLVLLVTLGVAPAIASAAEMHVPLHAAFYDFVADRARMIQVSVVIVALGCALLWWRR